MSLREFYFALSLPAQMAPGLLRELVSRVCSAACCAPDDTQALMQQVEHAVSQVVAYDDCEVRFEAHHGALDVAVRSGSRQLWRTSRPIV